MGLLDWAKNAGSRAWSGIKRGGAAAGNVIAGVGKKVYNLTTARITSEKNRKKYAALNKRDVELRASADRIRKMFGSDFLNLLFRINRYKSHFQQEAMPYFVELGANFAQWKVLCPADTEEKVANLPECTFVNAFADCLTLKPAGVVETLKSFVPIWNYFQAENNRRNLDIAAKTIDENQENFAEFRKKLEKSLAGMEQVADVFDFFNDFYDQLLVELDFSIQLMRSVRLWTSADFFDDEKIDVCFLPRHHLDCLIAADKTTRIICGMVSRQYIEQKSDKDIPTMNAGAMRMIEIENTDREEMISAMQLEKGA